MENKTIKWTIILLVVVFLILFIKKLNAKNMNYSINLTCPDGYTLKETVIVKEDSGETTSIIKCVNNNNALDTVEPIVSEKKINK